MQFKPLHSQSLFQGRLNRMKAGAALVALDGTLYGVADVAFAIPDDEIQAEALKAAGFKIHTPMSVYLGPGSTG